MPDRPPRDIFKEFIDATNHRDIARLASIVHPDFEDAYPQSGERIRGFENLRGIIENYPGGGYVGTGPERVVGVEDRWVMTPAFTMLRIEGAGDTFTGVSRGRYPDGSDWLIVTIGEVRDGRIWRCETYFAPTFDAPEWRSQWTDRAAAPGHGSELDPGR